MTSSAIKQPDPSPITACTISRDVQNFDLLIEDMEATMGETWGDLGMTEALAFLTQPEAETLEFVALAIDARDEEEMALLVEIIALAKARDIKIILVAEDISPATLHNLLRKGADEFVPYPLPEKELAAAIERLQSPPPANAAPDPASADLHRRAESQGEGVLFAVQGIAGGTGATTLAVNLAWELVNIQPDDPPRVCLLDFSLQFGSVATYLDLPRRDAVYETWSDTESMDDAAFRQTLLSVEKKLWVLTAPPDSLPLDFITPEDVERMLTIARAHFDYVIVDMPTTLVQWTETVLLAAPIYLLTLELDMRSAQNALRFKRALKSEELPIERLRFCLNRAPKFTDLTGRSRVKRLAESLDIGIELQLPDGGRAVMQSGDHGLPLACSAGKNPLRREIAKLAKSLHALSSEENAAAA